MARYDVVTVDWDQKQTTRWLRHLNDTCADFNVSLLPNERRYQSCWSSPKLHCLNIEFDTPYVIYMDTDTIITRDLWELIEWMEDAELGLSIRLGDQRRLRAYTKPHERAIVASFGLGKLPIHVPTGLMVFKGIRPKDVYEGWCAAFEKIDDGWPALPKTWGRKREGWSNEVSFSFWLATQNVKTKDIPKHLHHYMLGNDKYAKSLDELPMILHYHSRPERVARAGLGHLL